VDKGRLEAFSDAVIAIAITIMVLGLAAPSDTTWAALRPLVPAFLAYVLSFLYLAIYWNNHHHLIKAADHITNGALWANLNLLFWLSLFPFATDWVGKNHHASAPVICYGIVLLAAAFSYELLQTVIVRAQGDASALRVAIGHDVKGKTSLALYLVGIVVATVAPVVALLLFALVAVIWLVPDRRLLPLIQRGDAA